MPEATPLAQLVHRWELPIALEHEQMALKAVEAEGSAQGFRPDDYALVLGEATDTWITTGAVAPLLRDAVDRVLCFTPAVLDEVDARAYFEMHRRLRDGTGDVASLTHSLASRLLSRASLIAHLLGAERASCSQVARLLAATETSLDVPHGAIAMIARKLRLLPALDRETAGQDLWESDQALALKLFPDSTVAETCIIAGGETVAWLPEVDLAHLLSKLGRSEDPGDEPFWPYLQMLHWCLTPIEFYDHPASHLYEFAPRGQVGSELFDRYPTATGNPILNNAKAVQTLNATWARNRGGDDAHSLVAILRALESLPFVPRRQVARVLRAWLIRLIELQAVDPLPITELVTEELFSRVADYITRRETNTQGVIEQRVVDSLATLAFGKPGWRPRGLGDGVNASNFSRHKLGDIEFANVDERRAIALEAHGGHLSATYVMDHARSLGRIIQQRLDESWSALDDPDKWTVEVLFVAHSRDLCDLPERESLHGVDVVYKYIDYHELVDYACQGSTVEDRVAAFELHVVERLNSGTVRESTREKFREIVRSQREPGA